MTIWGIDVSRWQDESELSSAQWQALKAGGCAFAVLKAGQTGTIDGQLTRHVQNCNANEIPYGVYLWGDPIQDPVQQANWFVNVANTHAPGHTCLAVDAEQWWADWAAYWRYTRGEIGSDEVPRLPASVISERYRIMSERVRSLTGKPVMVYSSGYFIHYNAPMMAGWIADGGYPFWAAGYPVGPSPVTYAEFTAWLQTLADPYLGGVPGWHVWQVSSGGPNHPQFVGQNRLDLNYIRDAGVFANLFGGGTPPPPPQQTSYATGAVTVTGLRVRSGPGTGYGIIRIAQPGEVIRVRDFGPTTWIEINPGEWIAARYNGSQYVAFDQLP
jgi:GH25 family lysozyme M1 (1,4-beta-N-acetylmuramidase)